MLVIRTNQNEIVLNFIICLRMKWFSVIIASSNTAVGLESWSSARVKIASAIKIHEAIVCEKMIVLKRLQDTFCNEYLAMFGAAFGKVNPISEMVL